MNENSRIELYFGDASGCFGPLEGKLLTFEPNEDDEYYVKVTDSKFLEYVGDKEFESFANLITKRPIIVSYDTFVFMVIK